MRNKLYKIAQAAGLVLAITFTLSCSDDKDEGGGGCGGTVKIGTQTWQKCNLNVEASTGNSACYGDDPANCDKYGRLYDWEAAKSACPSGFHLPSKEEWNELTAYIEGNKNCTSCDAKHLKSKSGWDSDGNGLDSYGFSALPGGGFIEGYFTDAGGRGGRWWSASEDGAYNAYRIRMRYDHEYIDWDEPSKSNLLSVRCLQN